MVLYHASYYIRQASPFSQRGATSVGIVPIPTGVANDDEVTQHHGEAIYQLSGDVELDEAFFPIRIPEESKGDDLHRGAGSQRQAKYWL